MQGLRDSLREFMDAEGQSLTAISRSLGISTSALSQWLSDSYPGNVEKIDESVKSFLRRQNDRLKTPKARFQFVMTSAAETTIEVAGICHADGEAGVIYGEAGTGKTEAIKQYAKDNPDAILIEADLGYTATMVFADLAKRLGIDRSGRIHDLFEACVARLKDSGRLVIVDEAENLPYKALELLRRLHDKAGVGILLVGMPRLISNIRGNRGEFAQLYSRIGVAKKLDPLTEADSKAIVDTVLPGLNGLSRVFHAKSLGNARRLRKLLNRSVRIAQLNAIEVDRETIEAAAETLII